MSRRIRIGTIVGHFSRESLAIVVDGSLGGRRVVETLAMLALEGRKPRTIAMLAAQDADDGVHVPNEVALDIMRGKGPTLAFRNHQGITLRELSERTGVAAGYISKIERGRKPGSSSALARIAK